MARKDEATDAQSPLPDAVAEPEVLELVQKPGNPHFAMVRFRDYGGAVCQENVHRQELERTIHEFNGRREEDPKMRAMLERYIHIRQLILAAFPPAPDVREDTVRAMPPGVQGADVTPT